MKTRTMKLMKTIFRALFATVLALSVWAYMLSVASVESAWLAGACTPLVLVVVEALVDLLAAAARKRNAEAAHLEERTREGFLH